MEIIPIFFRGYPTFNGVHNGVHNGAFYNEKLANGKLLITVTGFADTDGTCQKRLKDILPLLLTKFAAFFKDLWSLTKVGLSS